MEPGRLRGQGRRHGFDRNDVRRARHGADLMGEFLPIEAADDEHEGRDNNYADKDSLLHGIREKWQG